MVKKFRTERSKRAHSKVEKTRRNNRACRGKETGFDFIVTSYTQKQDTDELLTRGFSTRVTCVILLPLSH